MVGVTMMMMVKMMMVKMMMVRFLHIFSTRILSLLPVEQVTSRLWTCQRQTPPLYFHDVVDDDGDVDHDDDGNIDDVGDVHDYGDDSNRNDT